MFMNSSTGEKQSVEVQDCVTLNSYFDVSSTVMVILGSLRTTQQQWNGNVAKQKV